MKKHKTIAYLAKISTVLNLIFWMLIAHAQIFAQGNEAVISGTVRNLKNEPVKAATISIRNEATGFTLKTTTNHQGTYLFKQVPLGDNYTVMVSALSFGSQKKIGFALNQGNQLVVNFELEANSEELDEVTVISNSLKKTIATLGASTAVNAKDLTQLPVNGRNFTSLIDLSPLSRGGSLAGQLASSTDYTIDGMSVKGMIAGGSTSGAYSISMEAIREFKVVTNEYDVTNGRAGGGTISTVTKSGTNTLQGSAFTYARTNWLSSSYDIMGNKTQNDFSTYQYGFSLGGPIVKDKAHFFVVWDRQQDSRPLNIANISNERDVKAFNVTSNTLERFETIGREKYGLSANPQFGSFDKRKSTDAAFARIDWQISPKNLLTLRNNFVYEYEFQSDGDNSGINAYESYIDRRKIDNSLMASLRSQVNSRITNELKGQAFIQQEFVIPNTLELPASSIPRAIVENVESVDTEGNKYYNSIQLGGQRYSPEWFKGTSIQVVNNTYYNTDNIKYTFGMDINYTKMNSRYGSEMNGRFYFTGLDNFENLTPYRYAREIYLDENQDNQANQVYQLSAAVYAQLETKLAKGLDFMGGVRLDNTQYLKGANYNEVAFNELGIRTDFRINTWQLQPRFQFNWDVNEKRKNIIRFGAGIFGSSLNPYSMINNMLFDGTKVASVDIIGAQVPTPDFPGYRANPTSAPGTELFNVAGVEKLITINSNSEKAKVPVLYKVNFSYNHFFSEKLRIGVSMFANWARNNYMYVDKNMVDQPYFTIDAESNRGVYVPANTINPQNGVANWVDGRKTTNLGRVLELISDGKKNQYAVVVDGAYRYGKDGQLSASYTWNDSKDNTSYNGNVANTATLSLMVASDPRDLSQMRYADDHFRHKLVMYAATPSFYGFAAGIRFSGISGTRYSLAVSGNMNGDFVSSNDLAFVYDPNQTTTPEYLRTGISSILSNPNVENSFKNYLKNSFGQIAERNGGINGFYGVFDLRITKKFNFVKKAGLEVTFDAFNVANMIKKEKGVNSNLGKQNLYTIRGFDTNTEQFLYNVRTSAGVATFSGSPFQCQLGLRASF